MKKRHYAFWLICLLLFTVTSCEKDEIGGNDKEDPTEEEIRPSDEELISRGWVTYKNFGAKGDGKTDDMLSISKAHDFANQHDLKVEIKGEDTYYIGGKSIVISIRTDTDFGNAKFIIDDISTERRGSNVFSVDSKLSPKKVTSVSFLQKNQKNINELASEAGLVVAVDSNVKRYIRAGANQNSGADQTDVFLVNKDGSVDKNTPILWDFNKVTSMTIFPYDEKTLTIRGGTFKTIANKEKSDSGYFRRDFIIRRSNVVVDGMTHLVTGEGAESAPYLGFIYISECANVTIRNTKLTGRKKYPTGAGTYDIGIAKAVNITFENCTQINDIHDSSYWGIMGSNYCKNLIYDNCELSRFDAHQGVANATIKNSKIGHSGLTVIGSGTLLVENTTISSSNLVGLRTDYGSTWEGEFIIRNCTFNPTGAKNGNVSLIGGGNSGKHYFGYDCYMPAKITFQNVTVNDSGHPSSYQGGAIFANFNKDKKDPSYVEDYPYNITKQVFMINVKTASGKSLRRSDNMFMFKDVIIE